MILASCYNREATTEAPAYGCGAGTREYFSHGNLYRCRQTGALRAVRVAVHNVATLTDVRIRIWRPADSGGWALVSEIGSILPLLIDGAPTGITLPEPVDMRHGDACSIVLTGTSDDAHLHAHLESTDPSYLLLHYRDNAPDAATGDVVAWADEAVIEHQGIPVELWMDSPDVLYIGNSIIAGHNGSGSGCEIAPEIANYSLANYVDIALGDTYTWHNAGIGSQTSTMIADRFTADAIAAAPAFVVANGCVNDIILGVDAAEYEANWSVMLAAARAAHIHVVVLLPLPWSGGTLADLAILDARRATLVELLSYFGGVAVETRDILGVWKPGGAPTNLWAMNPAYSDDGLHPTAAGYAAIASRVADAIHLHEQCVARPLPRYAAATAAVTYTLMEH